MARNKWLVLGGILSAAAAILHLAVIAGGPSWYRFFGAGEGMARAAERGSATPALITLPIAAILMVWALYAFSGAGLIRRLPLLRTALILISAVYLLRAFALVPTLALKPELVDTFAIVSSLVVLVYGVAYSIGTWRGWSALTHSRHSANPLDSSGSERTGMPINQNAARDEEILAYIADCQVRDPIQASVTLEMDSVFEIESLIELVGECMERARIDFSEAVRSRRSSDALSHALQVKNMKALQEKLRQSVRG